MGKRTGKPRGRPKGSKNKASPAHVERLEQAAEQVKAILPGAFAGDAHMLMMTIYKDQSLPMDTRLDAAKAAIKFEKPALQATAVMSPEDAEKAASQAPRATGEDHLSALSRRYAGGLRVIEGGAKAERA